MKIAFFSDIHANLPALEAVLADIDRQKPDMVYCLGDLVGYNIWPNEVIAEIRKRSIPTIMGNHDEALLFPMDAQDQTNKGITRRLTSIDNQKYLTQLPRNIALSFNEQGNKVSLLMVHGSMKAIDDYLTEDYPEQEVLTMMETTDILLCGHTHKPYHRIIPVGTAYKHVINIGSVGKPKDGDPRACYVMMELDASLSTTNSNSIEVTFMRVKYDVEKAAKAVEGSQLPNDYAEALRLAR
ncbi:MAG: metallophosphoesterase family protein [Marinoscillum sp.]